MPNYRAVPPKHTQFKPGQSGNPAGASKLQRTLTKERVVDVLSRFAHLSRKELFAVSESETTPMLEAMVANIMLKAFENGDASRLEFLLNRAYGKVKDEIEVTTNPQEEELRKLSLEQLIIFIQSNNITTKAIE